MLWCYDGRAWTSNTFNNSTSYTFTIHPPATGRNQSTTNTRKAATPAFSCNNTQLSYNYFRLKGSLKEYGPLACTNNNHSFLFLVETIWRAIVAAFHVLMRTQQYFQHLTTSYTIAQHHPSPGGGTTGRAVHDNTRLPSRQHGADIFLVSANIFAADGLDGGSGTRWEGSVELVLYILTF